MWLVETPLAPPLVQVVWPKMFFWSPVIISMLETMVLPLPAPKPPAQPSVVNFRFTTSHQAPILSIELGGTFRAVRLGQEIYHCMTSLCLVTISMLETMVLPPPAPKWLAQPSVVNFRFTTSHQAPILSIELVEILQEVLPEPQ